MWSCNERSKEIEVQLGGRAMTARHSNSQVARLGWTTNNCLVLVLSLIKRRHLCTLEAEAGRKEKVIFQRDNVAIYGRHSQRSREDVL